jgi:hypothetical protein
MALQNRTLVVFEGGVYKGRQSANEELKFLSISVGASELEIKESSGKFDFGNKVLSNVAAGTASGEVLVYQQRGAANGVASLDGGGKVPVTQLPSSVMTYEGTFDASATPAAPLLNGDVGADAGMVYLASVAGSYNFGAGAISFAIGDWAIYNGTIWEKSVNSNSVVSVNGFTGVVVLDSDDIAEGATNLYWTSARFDTAFGTKDTDDLAEGAVNFYYTEARFDASLLAKDTGDLAEGTNLYFTNERAQDAVGNILLDTASIDFTYDDVTPNISAVVLPAGVDHDQLMNYVANDHVDHSTVSIETQANSGLSGGGDITASRQLVIDPSNAPSVSAAAGDEILVADVSDSSNLKKVTVQSIIDVAGIQPITKSFTNDNGSAITVRQIVFVKSNGNVDLADKSSINDVKLAIVADTSIASAAAGLCHFKQGTLISGFSGLTPGASYFVGAAGAITATAPAVVGERVYKVGQAISATELEFAPEFIVELAS